MIVSEALQSKSNASHMLWLPCLPYAGKNGFSRLEQCSDELRGKSDRITVGQLLIHFPGQGTSLRMWDILPEHCHAFWGFREHQGSAKPCWGR